MLWIILPDALNILKTARALVHDDLLHLHVLSSLGLSNAKASCHLRSLFGAIRDGPAALGNKSITMPLSGLAVACR